MDYMPVKGFLIDFIPGQNILMRHFILFQKYVIILTMYAVKTERNIMAALTEH
jgi:hypothetical protein